MLGDPKDQSALIPLATISLNGFLYAGLAALMYYGYGNSIAVLAGTILVVIVVWIALLRL